MSLRITVRRLLIYGHRWLGIALGLLFITWFASGIVMMYARMPSLSEAERQARLPTLDFSTATIAPAATAPALGASITGVRLAMHAGRPVYKLTTPQGPRVAYADSGDAVDAASPEDAIGEARRMFPEFASSIRYETRLDTPDQWTLETARALPMHRLALGDPDESRVYVSVMSGDVLLKTTAHERRWAYAGAILHWIYLTPIRRHGAEWGQFIIWTSVLGVVMSVIGLVWGLWRYSPSRRYRLKRQPSRSPYAGWMWWHHYAGLIAGVATITWIFSGLLSMDPWDWHPGTSPTPEQRRAFSGGPLTMQPLTVEAIRTGVATLRGVKEAAVAQFDGQLLLATDGMAVPLTPHAAAITELPHDALLNAAGRAGGAAHVSDAVWLDRYDAYYYDREGSLALPVLRVRYDDPQRTWLYVNPVSGTIVRKEERLTRLNRWLYHGLHSLDFPFLYYRRPLWDVVVIVLSLAGLVLSTTTLAPALRRLRRHARRPA